jgi:hypothetical protein
MSLSLPSSQVWAELEKELFAVLGMVTPKGHARTAGIIYIVRDRKLYIGTGADTWKARHVAANPNVSLTIPIAKRIPLLPWIKIPAATITFSGTARLIPMEQAGPELLSAVFRQQATDNAALSNQVIIEVTPQGDFVTYGVGVPLMKMRSPELARGRAPVA